MKTLRLLPLPIVLGAFALSGCSAPPPEDMAKNTADDGSTPVAQPLAPTNAKNKGNLQTFTNSKQYLEGELKKNYVGFSFSYPKGWDFKREANDPKASNFVKIENAKRDKVKGDFTLENFAVGYFQSSGNSIADARLYPKLVQQLNTSFSKFPNYKKISEGATKIGPYSGYEFHFQSRIPKTQYGPVTMWGRTILLPNPKPGQRQGVALILLATSLHKDLKSANDVGVKGGLPVVLKTFKFE